MFEELIEAKFIKRKKWVWDKDKKRFVKKIKKYCINPETGENAKGYKVSGNTCKKMQPKELSNKRKAIKKMLKTKDIRKFKIARETEKIKQKRKARGL